MPAGVPPPWRTLPRALWAGLVDLVAPACCIGCHRRLYAEPGPVCLACLRRLERADPGDVSSHLCRLDAAEALDGAFALWLFDRGGTLQRIQHTLKYGNRPYHARALGRLVGQAFAESRGGHPLPEAVVPVPLHRSRLYERGYNQSAYLAEGVAAALDRPLRAGLLRRVRATRSQTRLSRAARWENVHGAFALTPGEPLDETHLLLVDDVLTTGATAAAAALTLRAAGAHSVWLATLAMART